MSSKAQVNYEYGDLLTTLLLCNHNNPGNNAALKSCAYRVMQRVVTHEIRQVCWHIIRIPEPVAYLEQKCNAVEKTVDLMQFLHWTRTNNDQVLV
ncbi:hypothetical protein [Vibrio phage vB_VhaP_PG11]|nr:hypothetical protein [Vibrio phage vB_VhaP_PG11]